MIMGHTGYEGAHAMQMLLLCCRAGDFCKWTHYFQGHEYVEMYIHICMYLPILMSVYVFIKLDVYDGLNDAAWVDVPGAAILMEETQSLP